MSRGGVVEGTSVAVMSSREGAAGGRGVSVGRGRELLVRGFGVVGPIRGSCRRRTGEQ